VSRAPDHSDEDLVRVVQADPRGSRGRAAASELFERHQARVFGWCFRYARERERALDLTQEVFARVWQALPGYGFRSKFSWWLFVITRNRCLNAVSAPALLRDEEVSPDSIPAAESDPAEAFERRADEEEARRLMMETLDEQERVALWLRGFERMSIEDITRTLGLTNTTGARGLLQRARRKLRSALAARAEEEAE
jgi:RNA polymerase sigma-70 factor (ECF subfamily)